MTACTSFFVGGLDAERAHACAKRPGIRCPCYRVSWRSRGRRRRSKRVIPRRALTLVYLDPYNLKYLSFEIIRRLAEIPRVDFAIHFSTMDLRRNVLMEFNPERALRQSRSRMARTHRPRDVRPGRCRHGFLRLLVLAG